VSTTRPFKADTGGSALSPGAASGGGRSARGDDYSTRAKLRLLTDKMSMQTSEAQGFACAARSA
jgi:hypothetical protein